MMRPYYDAFALDRVRSAIARSLASRDFDDGLGKLAMASEALSASLSSLTSSSREVAGLIKSKRDAVEREWALRVADWGPLNPDCPLRNAKLAERVDEPEK